MTESDLDPNSRSLADPRRWIALASLALVATLAIVSAERTAPGPLSAVHSQVPELNGPESCNQCHGGWFQSMQSACLECHAPIAKQLEEKRGIHGKLTAGAQRCAECHSDHHGHQFPLVGAMSFAKAGTKGPEGFDHSFVGFEMSGKHLELACDQCHEQANVPVLPPGTHRFLGLESNCATCHEDPHQGAMARSCTDCHVQESFATHHFADHDRHLALVGGHAELSCRECHGTDGQSPLEAVAARGVLGNARTCVDCHESPHAESFVRSQSAVSHQSEAASCAACHQSEHGDFLAARELLTVEQHLASGFPLDGQHAGLECSACHDPNLGPFHARFPGRGATQCAACHEDVHAGQFDHGPFAEAGCVGCHGSHGFKDHQFGVQMHERAAFPLEQSHTQVDCHACHQVPHGGGPRVFRGTSNQCATCHQDAHEGFFAARLAERAPQPEGDCAQCHEPSAFRQVPLTRFDHGEWTGFPLGGAHDQEGCAACHARGETPDLVGRTFGRVRELFGPMPKLRDPHQAGQTCALCHEDPHQGRFDAPHLPATVGEDLGCARCHDDTSFRHLPRGFDHGLWTGHPLTGAHSALDCSACHAPLWPPGPGGRTWQPALGTSCADCHRDPHGGQFAREGRVDCARCHKDPSSWVPRSFDHNWDTRFPLDSTHAALECSACHQPKRIQGVDTFHYRPLGTACTDCHGVQAGSLRRKHQGK